MPSVQLCMGCHSIIATDAPAVKQLTDFWDRQQPIPWVRLYRLPGAVQHVPLVVSFRPIVDETAVLFGDGCGASQPWLQGSPDPMTTIAWQTWVEIHPDTARTLGITYGDVVRVTSPHGSLEAPAYLFPTIRRDTVGIPIGQGDTDLGRFARDRGANPMLLVEPLADASGSSLAWSNLRVSVVRTGRWVPLAKFENTQGVPSLPTATPEPTETPTPPGAPPPPPARPSMPGGPGLALSLSGDPVRGLSQFGLFCATCHGPEGLEGFPNPGSEDGAVPDLNPIDPSLANPDPKVFAANLDLFIQHGSVPAGPAPLLVMPPFGDSNMLTQQQIADLIAYIISLNTPGSS